MLSPNQPVELTVQRGNEYLDKTIIPEPTGPEQFGNPGWVPLQPLTVTFLEPDMPAAAAGLKVGDEIVAINNESVRSTPSLLRHLQETKDQPVTLTLLRDGQQQKLTVTPVYKPDAKEYRIGFASDPQHVEKLGFAAAFAKSVEQNKRYSFLILELVQEDGRAQGLHQADGRPDRHCTRLRTSRPAEGLDSAAGADGGDQSQPRHLQPVPHSDSRWWIDHAVAHRVDHASRHQSANQGTSLPGGFRLPDPVCRNGDLQRRDEGIAWTGTAHPVTQVFGTTKGDASRASLFYLDMQIQVIDGAPLPKLAPSASPRATDLG